ncbi:tRNA (adenosine(37)-N6)-dimethylallyltransferase MiaA [Rhodoligotrophos defluvii]|uniref:tRNA (adenosine(37)-N6)-dimethylallyltransferase MiaA n=1 Tax=Rhodoligotrophos defluvii TaxID=2561934 RepID=UPI0010C9554A|nr:tRNA (adenosine(37)-N6)-dimethylallyltransferase MiaA [Rhodoligotrophos defluvii]
MPQAERPNSGESQRRVVLIAGPTASGKSALALALAQRTDGVVINADAMQVYRDLAILTSRPSPEDMATAPHRLYGHVQAEETYSAARWLAEAEAAISTAWDEERLPVVVGGTGLYFRALEQGLAEIPPIPDAIRRKWREALAEQGSAALHVVLAARDPETAAALRPSDGQRVVRALEVLDATGTGLSRWQARGHGARLLQAARVTRLILSPDRQRLYATIDRRFAQMIDAGALDEVRALITRRLDPSLPAMKAIGVAELADVVEGRLALDEAIRMAQQRTRRYAKRQMTWFRNQMAAWRTGDPQDPRLLDMLLAELAGR